MFRIIYGVAGTGKTTRLLDEIAKRAEQKLMSLLLVPEQYSATAETLLYRRLGDAGGAFADVVSFRTLSERMLRAAGALGQPVLTDAGRTVYVRRALDALGPNLQVFARQRRSPTFCNLCAQTLLELKTAGATPEVLREIAMANRDGKMAEIALIFEAYEAEIEGAAIDPDDRLTLAAQCKNSEVLDDTAVFIDGFDGFTAPEYALIAQLLQGCDALTVTLCCDALHGEEDAQDLFSPVRKTAGRLRKLAQQAGRMVEEPVELRTIHRAQQPALAALNRVLSGAAVERQSEGALFLTPARDEWEEMSLVAAEMRRLAVQGVPYSAMALVCRDIAEYQVAVRRQFALYGIPVFMDETGTVEYSAPVVFLRAALALHRQGLTSQPILQLVKSGLLPYQDDEISALENYVYTWSPKAAHWREPFAEGREGLLRKPDAASEAERAKAEGIRSALIPVLTEFMQNTANKTVLNMSKRLYILMDRLGAAEQCEALAARLEAEGEAELARQTRQAWDLAMGFLEQMAALLPNEQLPAEEYEELLMILVRSSDVGMLPQALECVSVTSADRMRLEDVQYVFVAGVNEGDFPRRVGYSGLLTHTDRDVLVKGGVMMPGSFENRMLMEDMFFYRALTAASKRLYLSWPRQRAGQARAMSAALKPVEKALAPQPLQLDVEHLAATPEAAYEMLGRSWREQPPLAASLKAALEALDDTRVESALELLEGVDNPGHYEVGDRAALKSLVGRDLRLSATRAEQYYLCRFAYYMERILRVKPRSKAELSPAESGTLVHYILEKVLEEAGEGFAACSNVQLGEMMARHADAFIAAEFPDDAQRNAWRLGQIKDAALRLLCFLRDVVQESAFCVDALELQIGDAERGVPALGIGGGFEVTGMIDRVDVYRDGGKTYLCIVDYKMGEKRFSLDEIYCGKNMQMMIYLRALQKQGAKRYENAQPAAVLYLTGDPSPATGRRGGEAQPFAFDGLLLEDAGVLRALGGSNALGALPYRFNKDGGLRAGKSLASAAEFEAIQAHVEKLLGEMAKGIFEGHFPARPLVSGDSSPCLWCAYRAVCRHEDGENESKVAAPKDAFKPQEHAGEVSE